MGRSMLAHPSTRMSDQMMGNQMMGSQMMGSQMMGDPHQTSSFPPPPMVGNSMRNNQPGDLMMHRDSSPQRQVVSSPLTSSALQRLESQTAAPANSKYTYGPITVVPQED